jgi:hypothetical protein
VGIEGERLYDTEALYDGKTRAVYEAEVLVLPSSGNASSPCEILRFHTENLDDPGLHGIPVLHRRCFAKASPYQTPAFYENMIAGLEIARDAAGDEERSRFVMVSI